MTRISPRPGRRVVAFGFKISNSALRHCERKRRQSRLSPREQPGVRRRVAPHDDGGETYVRILATELARALHHPPPQEQRAQGRPGGRCTRGPRAKKICASAREPQVQTVTTGLPCAMAYGLYALSSVNHPVCHRRRPRCASIAAGLAPDLGAPGPHDFTVRKIRRSSVGALRVHRIPASRLVTTAIRPSASEAGWREDTTDSTFLKTEIFSRAWVDRNSRSLPVGQINLWIRIGPCTTNPVA
jgi:hypothetical protein